ncbi:amidohydrolase family protein [Streptomyces sp. NPDC057067]|uniref:amidohydrolase family protein n=1 Tax=unclassified Streptomyces TaxID=2593676 RepID=UPI0027B9A1A9|nr:amidohydrolase family protein [Streptomyces sp. rh34]
MPAPDGGGGIHTRAAPAHALLTHDGGALPRVADRFELFRVLLAGGSADAPSAVERLGRLWYDLAGTPLPRQIPAFGTERLLYGSDYCWTPVDMALAQVHSVDSAAQPSAIDTWRELTKRNAQRLFTTTAERLPDRRKSRRAGVLGRASNSRTQCPKRTLCTQKLCPKSPVQAAGQRFLSHISVPHVSR